MNQYNDYKDIINLPYHKSTGHKQMSIKDRAAQFSPFAALTGYDEKIREASQNLQKQYLPDGRKI